MLIASLFLIWDSWAKLAEGKRVWGRGIFANFQ